MASDSWAHMGKDETKPHGPEQVWRWHQKVARWDASVWLTGRPVQTSGAKLVHGYGWSFVGAQIFKRRGEAAEPRHAT